MTADATETCSTPPTTVAAQYDTLRRAWLGEALPPEARRGLMLFVSRGMWAWARTLAAQGVCEEPTPSSTPGPTAPCERKTIIHVLASLAIAVRDRRAR